MTRLLIREIQIDGEADGPRKIDDHLAVIQLDACPQPARSMTLPQFLQARRS
jgi:hypothetical protein